MSRRRAPGPATRWGRAATQVSPLGPAWEPISALSIVDGLVCAPDLPERGRKRIWRISKAFQKKCSTINKLTKIDTNPYHIKYSVHKYTEYIQKKRWSGPTISSV